MTFLPAELIRPDDFSPAVPEDLKQSIVSRFEQMAALYPDRIAVHDPEQTLTYRALNAAANRLARVLLASFDGPAGAPIGLLLRHDSSAIIALIAVLKTGRPYLALHAGNPVERQKAILAHALPAGLLTTRQYQDLVNESSSELPAVRVLYLEDIDLTIAADNPGIHVSPDDPFGIYYTSGSTGVPKGILVSHLCVYYCVYHQINGWYLSPSDRIALLTSIGFGAAYATVFNALLTGAALCVYDFRTRGVERTLEWIATEQISVLRLTPSMFRAIFESAPDDLVFSNVRVVTLGGEQAKGSDVPLFRAHTGEQALMVNIYASTEAGPLAMYPVGHMDLITDEYLPAGFPIPGQDIALLDDAGRPVKPGEEGEIVVTSRYMSSGYWNQPELTAQRFITDPTRADLKTLHIGDLGRWRADGVLEYRGRKDLQAKIRGYRVDTAEIESTLRAHPLVQEAVVVVRPARHRPDQMQLSVCVVLHPGGAVTSASLREYLAARLPDYAMPSFIIFLDKLPLSVNGKVDLQALPDLPAREDLDAGDLPADEVEQKLVEIWRDLLHVDTVSVHDNFFELGGDSLLALSMSLEVERSGLGRLPQSFFKDPTARNLARSLREGDVDEADGGNFILKGHRRTGRRSRLAALRRRIKEGRRGLDETLLFEWLLFRFMQGLTFEKARALIFRLADRPAVLNIVYRSKRKLFERLLQSLGISTPNPAALFRLNFIANLLFKMVDARNPFAVPSRSPTDRTRTSIYVRDREQFVEATPIDQLDEFFPVEGMAYLEDAYREKRGAILLSFHGTAANSVANHNLARRLGSPPFQTIAFSVALSQSTVWGSGIRRTIVSPSVEASLYAELAYHGESILRRGGVIHIAADLAKGPGRMYSIVIGDRVYSIKAGFAELALHAGARLIPMYARYVENGRMLVTLLPPLDPGTGNREEQIDALNRQYADFMNAAIRLHPEMMAWHKIRNHLRLPRATNPAPAGS